MSVTRNIWTLEDQYGLEGQRGLGAKLAAGVKYRRLRRRAERRADASTREHLARHYAGMVGKR